MVTMCSRGFVNFTSLEENRDCNNYFNNGETSSPDNLTERQLLLFQRGKRIEKPFRKSFSNESLVACDVTVTELETDSYSAVKKERLDGEENICLRQAMEREKCHERVRRDIQNISCFNFKLNFLSRRRAKSESDKNNEVITENNDHLLKNNFLSDPNVNILSGHNLVCHLVNDEIVATTNSRVHTGTTTEENNSIQSPGVFKSSCDLKSSSDDDDDRSNIRLMDFKVPTFDFETVELTSKLKPLSLKNPSKIRINLKRKFGIKEIGRAIRKHLMACVIANDDELTNSINSTLSLQSEQKQGVPQNTINVGEAFGTSNNPDLIHCIADAQTIDDELPVDLAAMLIDLQSRDMTPEDYEMLLMLEDSVQKTCISKTVLNRLPVESITSEEISSLCHSSESVPHQNSTSLKENNFNHKNNLIYFCDDPEVVTTTTTTTTTTIRESVTIISADSDKNISLLTKTFLESSNTEEVIKTFQRKKISNDSQTNGSSVDSEKISFSEHRSVRDPRNTTEPFSQHRSVRDKRNTTKPSPDTRNSKETNILNTVCTICQEVFEIGQRKMTLPCLHFFHEACAIKWLTESSKNCPLDGLEVIL